MSDYKQSNFLKGSVKEFETNKGTTGYNIKINVEDLKRFPINKYGEVSLTMYKRKDLWKFWDTHFLVENDYDW